LGHITQGSGNGFSLCSTTLNFSPGTEINILDHHLFNAKTLGKVDLCRNKYQNAGNNSRKVMPALMKKKNLQSLLTI
jgi:hypothetical protein